MTNNTTAETCLNALNETIDCIPLDTSSLLDDIEVILLSVAALLAILAWGMKKYKELSADGSISLDEVIDSMSEIKEKVAEVKEEVETIEETVGKHVDLDSLTVAQLKEKLKKAGLSVSGKKAELVQRLKDSEE